MISSCMAAVRPASATRWTSTVGSAPGLPRPRAAAKNSAAAPAGRCGDEGRDLAGDGQLEPRQHRTSSTNRPWPAPGRRSPSAADSAVALPWTMIVRSCSHGWRGAAGARGGHAAVAFQSSGVGVAPCSGSDQLLTHQPPVAVTILSLSRNVQICHCSKYRAARAHRKGAGVARWPRAVPRSRDHRRCRRRRRGVAPDRQQRPQQPRPGRAGHPERVHREIERLGFTPNAAAQQLRRRKASAYGFEVNPSGAGGDGPHPRRASSSSSPSPRPTTAATSSPSPRTCRDCSTATDQILSTGLVDGFVLGRHPTRRPPTRLAARATTCRS